MVVAMPWGHHVNLLAKIEQPAQRQYYLQATARFGWSRNVLLNQIKAQAYERSLAEGKSHKLPTALPEHLAEQAEEAAEEQLQPGVPGHPATGQGTRARRSIDRPAARLHSGAGLRLAASSAGSTASRSGAANTSSTCSSITAS
jgi:hypothetical protein